MSTMIVISGKAAAIPHRIEIMRECLLLEQHGVDYVKPAEKAANDGPGDRTIVGVGTARRVRRQTPKTSSDVFWLKAPQCETCCNWTGLLTSGQS